MLDRSSGAFEPLGDFRVTERLTVDTGGSLARILPIVLDRVS
jgi:hypothetical protein